MDASQIVTTVFSGASTVIVSLLAWFLKNTVNELKEADRKNHEELEHLKQDFNDLKSDLPLVYTLREDFIRTLNNVDNKMGDIANKLDKILLNNKE